MDTSFFASCLLSTIQIVYIGQLSALLLAIYTVAATVAFVVVVGECSGFFIAARLITGVLVFDEIKVTIIIRLFGVHFIYYVAEHGYAVIWRARSRATLSIGTHILHI